jgi:transposase
VIGLPRGVEVFMYAQPCDMRRSFNTLSLLVSQSMGRDLLHGDLFVFVSNDRRRCKVLYFDGTGLCLFAKGMEAGHHFPLPAGSVCSTPLTRRTALRVPTRRRHTAVTATSVTVLRTARSTKRLPPIGPRSTRRWKRTEDYPNSLGSSSSGF